MAGFANPNGRRGGLGGLGGTPWPERVGAPTSQEVNRLPGQEEWLQDWQSRYNAEAGRARDGFYSPAATSATRGPIEASSVTMTGGGPGGLPNVTMLGNAFSESNPDPRYGRREEPGPVVNQDDFTPPPQTWNDAYVPDFSELNAEKDMMMGQYDNQARQQQAYNGMAGNGVDGVLPADYSDPTHGQITGQSLGQAIIPGSEELQDAAYGNGNYVPSSKRKTNQNFDF